METRKGKIALKILIALSMVAIPALIVWATPPSKPTVDGMLEPDDEYDEQGSGIVQQGDYSKCYGRYVAGEGLYVCNDWYNPDENYDPNDECDGMNQFDWTDTGYSPWYKYWRIKVHGDSTVTVLWTWQNDGEWHEIEDPAANGWEQATGYNTSKNDEFTEHPIWELLIPKEELSGGAIDVGIIDPKFIDPEECPSADDSAYGPAPTIQSSEFSNWGC